MCRERPGMPTFPEEQEGWWRDPAESGNRGSYTRLLVQAPRKLLLQPPYPSNIHSTTPGAGHPVALRPAHTLSVLVRVVWMSGIPHPRQDTGQLNAACSPSFDACIRRTPLPCL